MIKDPSPELLLCIRKICADNNIEFDPWLSEAFLAKFRIEVIDWRAVSRFVTLSEEFIIAFQDVVDWNHISRYQKLSEKFLDRFLHLFSQHHSE